MRHSEYMMLIDDIGGKLSFILVMLDSNHIIMLSDKKVKN